ncbi:nitroreductase family protein [Kitasatospora sp. NPDC036755]|uniref:nitroreductase family protein n=1 Tax=Kitasatospora sp. NPDC036755 TaxID=3154600 RepID=UPI00340EC36D
MADNKLVSAQDMRRAVATDPQFRPPTRPALCRGLVVVPLPDGILVEGGPSRQVLRGTATRDLVPKLLPLFDGTRELSDIADQSDVPVEHVEQVSALLYTCGLLEEGEAPDSASDSAVAPYWSRNLDSTRVNRNAREVQRRLAETRVAVVGRRDVCALIRDNLTEAGATHVALADGGIPDIAPDLLIAIADDERTDLQPLASWCATHGVPLLPVHVSHTTLDLGPYIDPEFTVSYAEVQRHRDGAASGTDRPSALDDGVARSVIVALITNQVTALVGRVGSTPVLRGLVRTDLDAWQQSLYVIAPIPDRPDARSALTSAGVPLALAFETSVAFSPRRLLNPRDHQMHYKPGNIALQHESKRWPSARTVVLPGEGAVPHRPLDADTAPSVDRVTLDHLTSVLLRGAGRREDPTPTRHVQRWAPTGGNLGSVQLHALAGDVDGLPAGIWGYESAAHRLALLGDATEHGLPEAGDGPAVTIVLTGALARVASKYSAFAWRVVHLDAGVAIAQMAHVARSLGLRAQPLDRWDDLGLAALLDLDLDAEPVTGVLTLRPSAVKER